MEISKICIYFGGFLSLVIALFHTQFYKRFGWKKEFDVVSFRNQRIFYTIHLALMLLFFVFAYISFVYADELSHATGLAFGICISFSLFWLWRTIWQIVYFKIPKNSKIKKMPMMHYILIVIFLLLCITYLIPVVL